MTTATLQGVSSAAGWQPLDTHRFRELMATVAEPVVVVTARDVDGDDTGLTVSSFTSVSLRPTLVLFCVARSSRTWSRIAPTGRFAVNVLGADAAWVADRFAAPVDRFEGLAQELSPAGVPVLADALSSAECQIVGVHPGGDHDIVVGQVWAAVTRRAGPPLMAEHTRSRPEQRRGTS